MSRFEPGVRRALPLSLFLILSILPSAQAQRGAITLPRNLVQMTSRAATVLRGRVIYAHAEAHPQYPNLNSVVVVMSVKEIFKGTAGQTLTFRQFIWDPRDRIDQAGYREGDELVLFLNCTSNAGFTSPVGLEQGRFRVVARAGGEAMVLNGARNIRLFQGTQRLSASPKLSSRARRLLAQAPDQGGPIPLSVLKEILHTLASETGGTQ